MSTDLEIPALEGEVIEGPDERIWALWWGGSSYSQSYIEDLEVFPNMQAAKDAFLDRYESGRFQEFAYWHKPTEVTDCPAVSEDCAMTLYKTPPVDTNDVPDTILTMAVDEVDGEYVGTVLEGFYY